MTQLLCIYTLFPADGSATRVASQLLDEKIIACANVFETAVTSHYVWQGMREASTEQAVILKTTADAYNKLEARLKELHPYETPCIAAIAADKVEHEYLQWLINSVKG